MLVLFVNFQNNLLSLFFFNSLKIGVCQTNEDGKVTTFCYSKQQPANTTAVCSLNKKKKELTCFLKFRQ